MLVWLIAGTSGKEYERRIVDAAHRLRDTASDTFDGLVAQFLAGERASQSKDFRRNLLLLSAHDIKHFRLRYLLAKITQYVEYSGLRDRKSRLRLADYTAGGNDIEHILPDNGHADAIAEFGDGAGDQALIQSLGNLLLIEKSINRSISNGRYSGKIAAYNQSKFLLTKCQAGAQQTQVVGVADKITKTVQSLKSWPTWSKDASQGASGVPDATGAQCLGRAAGVEEQTP